MKRAYELMVIIDSDVGDAENKVVVDRVEALIGEAGGELASTDRWGRRKFAYLINHKSEGYYVVFELTADPAKLDPIDRFLRLADEVVRHKLIRLPDEEAARRGLLAASVED
ncbi:MAG: 30S ribosomal protein S6 [Microthrixaceae bacterium]